MTAIRPVSLVKKVVIGTVSAAVLSAAAMMSTGVAAAATTGTFSVSSGKSGYAFIENSTDGVVDTSFTVPSTTARPVYVGLQFRSPSGATGYRTRMVIAADGTVRAGFSRVVNGAEKVLLSEPIGLTVKAGDKVNLEGSVTGTSVVSLKVRAWVGSVKPAWQKSYSDSTAARITTGNTVRAWAFLSGSATAASTVIAFQPVAAAPAPAPAPVAAPSTSAPATDPSSGATAAPSTDPSTAAPTDAPSTDAPSTAEVSAPAPTASPTTAAPVVTAPAVTAPAVPTKPSAATTGPTTSSLTRYDGNITVTKAGTVLEGMDIYGFVNVKAANVIIRNSIVRGGTATSNMGVITNYGFENLLVEDVLVQPRVASVWVDGVKGWNFTLNRVHVIGGVDNVKIHGDNVTIKDSLLEKTTYFASDPNQGGNPTHNDSVQILKGMNLNLIGNTIRETSNFTILGGAEQGNVSLNVRGNWLDGGHCTVKLQNKNGYRQDSTISDNKFGPTRAVAKCVIQAHLDVAATATNNTMELTNGPVAILWDNA